VEARDRGPTYSFGPRRVDTATVTILVEQVNRHDPEMTIQHLPEVIEQSHTDIYAIIRVRDPDQGRHGQVRTLPTYFRGWPLLRQNCSIARIFVVVGFSVRKPYFSHFENFITSPPMIRQY
jgi:hypothetical protein